MDYEKKYKEALERCRKEFNFNNLAYSNEEIRQRLESVFPELKESEDERIIRTLKEIANWGCAKNISVENNVELKDCIAWLEKQGGQKPTEKVEPKFHEGDWAAINPELRFASPICIKDIGNNNYRVESVDGDSGAPTIDYLDNHYHLWTIQDAKDGDVLVYEDEIFLLKTYTLWHKIVYHCCYDEKVLHNHSIYESLKKEDFENIHPADQEQRDLLFTKMKESGYGWDAEKKELKKIEDESTWSEEDIRNLQDIDSILFYDRRLTEDVRTRLRDSLKSLKDRVLPQPKSTWSEEGESHIGRILSYLESFKAYNIPHIEPIKKEIDWLKSLKERYTWKPSDEQMEALYTYIYNPQYFNSPDQRMELVESVYKDLKKLREE